MLMSETLNVTLVTVLGYVNQIQAVERVLCLSIKKILFLCIQDFTVSKTNISIM